MWHIDVMCFFNERIESMIFLDYEYGREVGDIITRERMLEWMSLEHCWELSMIRCSVLEGLKHKWSEVNPWMYLVKDDNSVRSSAFVGRNEM